MEVSEAIKKKAEDLKLPIKPPREKPREMILPKPHEEEKRFMPKPKEICGACGKIIYEYDLGFESCNNEYCPYRNTPIMDNHIQF